MRDITDIADVKRRFLGYLTLEKGMSRNTAQAYGDDVDKLTRYLTGTGVAVEHATTDDLERFVCTLQDVGIQPRSQARIISGIKGFYKFLRLEGYMDSDPTELLPTPKIGRHLPEVLTIAEIDSMIAAIDMSKPEGQRNRAIIETLYGCGLRVSELVSLRLSQLFLEERYVVVLGKGNKQRLVPISPVAIEQIALYLEQTRSRQVDGVLGTDFLEKHKAIIDYSRSTLYLKINPDATGSLWNFTKFLISKDGETIKRYAPTTEPKDFEKDIEELL